MKRRLVPAGIPALDLIPLLAHDLRTPVTAIKGFSQLILRQPNLPARVEDYGTTVVTEADHISSLIDDLVLVASAEVSGVQTSRVPLDLRHVLRRALDRPKLARGATQFRVEIDATEIPIVGDPILAERALVNVLFATLKYCRPNDNVQINVKTGSFGTEISIEMPPRDSFPLRSGQVVPSSTDVAASEIDFEPRNLTLYLSTRLVELLGAQLWEGEFPQDRTLFLIRFPRYSEAMPSQI
jgi:K+-sensing histidine kinase KdpD